MTLEFPTVKLLQYRSQLSQLLNDPNPFALVTAAHLLSQQTHQDQQARYDAKWQLARLLYERDWDKQRIIDLFSVIDWLMKLSPVLEQRLWTAIESLERNLKMPYVSSVERIGLAKGMEKGLKQGLEQGRQQGLEQGLEQGRQQEALTFLRRLLERRFGQLPGDVETRLTAASLAELEAWGERLLEANSLEAVFTGDNGPEA
jgi:hypothetical protein